MRATIQVSMTPIHYPRCETPQCHMLIRGGLASAVAKKHWKLAEVQHSMFTLDTLPSHRAQLSMAPAHLSTHSVQ